MVPKVKYRLPQDLGILFPHCISEINQNRCPYKTLHTDIYNSIIHNYLIVSVNLAPVTI